jgi:CheY-like chemotaxis protein
MGGRITVESKEGYGTTFSFTVELEQGSSERLEERLALDKDVDGSILDGLRILITDDNEYNRIVAKDTLMSKANVEVHEAEDGQAAIDLVGKMPFDVILMDIQMPGMNGYDATRAIRSDFESPVKDTPIIALTASVLRTDLDKCKQAGMDSYIPKPFKAQQLITGIAQVLGIKLKVSKTATTEVGRNGLGEGDLGSVTDMTYLHGFCEGDEEKMKKYIRMFTSTAPALVDKIKMALENNDLDDIAGQVHAFKTKWIMMGMTGTKDLALELERQCREGAEQERITENAERLISHITRSLIELDEGK